MRSIDGEGEDVENPPQACYNTIELLRAHGKRGRRSGIRLFPRWRIPGKVHGKGCLLKKDKEVIYYAYCNYGYQLGR